MPPADPTVAADLAALARIRRARVEAAAAYRDAHAAELGGTAGSLRRRGRSRAGDARDAGLARARSAGCSTSGPAPAGSSSCWLRTPSTASDSTSITTCCSWRAPRSATRSSRTPSVRHGDLHRPPFEAASFDVGRDASRAASARRPGRRGRPTPRGCCARAAGCWSSTSPPTIWASCATSTVTCTSGSPTRRCRTGRMPPAWSSRASGRCRLSRRQQRLTVRLWLLRRRSRGPVMRAMI